ncbi:MAG: single-stranded-DNA-specific exonuclease RecJ, partial [Methylobacterium sp.]
MSAAPASLISEPPPFLGVSASVTGRRWQERCAGSAVQNHIAKMVQAHGLPELLARVLAGRQVAPDEAARHLAPRLRDLMPDPDTLLDMDVAVRRLVRAIRCGEIVAVFGDYDVDGAASAAMLAGYLRQLGLRAPIHIPDRITEGYGPNVAAITALAAEGATLLVCVDCGTSGHGPLKEAEKSGLDVIVLDHHAAAEVLPPARAIVNPNRLDDLSGLGHLCAAGVVFLTLAALNRALRRDGFFGPHRPEPALTDAL